jgi:3-deoxy-7-phosphoheptulonate synthase
MIIQLHGNIEPAANAHIIRTVNQLGYTTTEVHTQFGRYIIGIGKANFDIRTVGQLPGVMDVHQVSDDYQLVSRKWKVAPTTAVDVAGEMVGNGGLALLAGPCSIESEEQVVSVIEHLRANQIPFMRGGVFKPRSSPYAFRGLGIEGLKMWSFLARQAGIKIVSEVMQVSQIADMHDYVDVFQVGARNTQNFNLLDELGKVDKPVMLKRGISGTIEELLHSAEYVFSAGELYCVSAASAPMSVPVATHSTLTRYRF